MELPEKCCKKCKWLIEINKKNRCHDVDYFCVIAGGYVFSIEKDLNKIHRTFPCGEKWECKFEEFGKKETGNLEEEAEYKEELEVWNQGGEVMGIEQEPVYGLIEAKERISEFAKASYQYINVDIQDIKKNFIRLGFHLAECRDNKYYKDFGFDNFYDFVEKNFHMEKSAVSRHINIFMKFSQPSNCSAPYMMFLDDKYKKYSYSQLSEMLQLNDNQMKQIKPEMTIKEIRELKKSWKEKPEVATVATKKCKCRLDDNYICNIEEVMKKHFIKRGNIVGCAGCCNGCLNKKSCEYCCEFTKEKLKFDERKDNRVIGEVEYVEVAENEQPEIPVLRNMEEREKFILGFKNWDIWCQNELTEETYYRFNLPDGAAIVVRSYPVYLEWKKEEVEGKELFLLKPGYKHFKNCETNMTIIKNYLKDLQKDKK